MKKVILVLLSIFVVMPLLAAAACYGVIWYQFKDTFMPGIFINDVYTSDMTPAEVNEKLKENAECPELVITDKKGESYSFSLAEIDYDQDFLEELEEIHQEQSVLKFIQWFMGENISYDEYMLEPVATFDKDLLQEYLDTLSYLQDNSDPKDKIVEIRKDHNGYYLYDETKDLFSHDRAEEIIEQAVSDAVFEVDLYKEGCYIEVDHTSQMQSTLERWEDLSRFLNSQITYEFNTDSGICTEVIDGAVISDFIAVDEEGEFLFDESGSFYLDEERIKEYISSLAEKYNSVNKPRRFRSTRGEYITVDTGTYGCKLDETAELEYLMEVIGRGVEETHVPAYQQISYTGLWGTEDIGDTYIEIDMTEQMMYYYRNGQQIIDTPVVTGNVSAGNGTPQKVCFVYFKQRNRVLRGEDYETPVSYWMAVYGNIGIHDANWRGKFGGRIYRTNGSHGCINTPTAAVKTLYNMVEEGTPVIIFY